MKRTIKKSELKRLVEGVLNELDWKTYASAGNKAQDDELDDFNMGKFSYKKGKGWTNESKKKFLRQVTEMVIRKLK